MRELITIHISVFRRMAYAFTRSTDAGEDLLQDTLLKMLQNERLFDGKNLIGWGAIVMRHTFYSQRRKRIRYNKVDYDDDYAKRLTAPPNAPYALELSDAIALLKGLTAEKRDAILSAAIGESYAEAAHSVAEGTIKSRIHRGREELTTQRLNSALRPQIGMEIEEFFELVRMRTNSIKKRTKSRPYAEKAPKLEPKT